MAAELEAVLAKLTPILQDTLENDDVVATPELTADDVEGWDSLAHVRLIIAVERAFKVHFSAAEVSSFKNVGELAAAVQAKI